MAEKIVKEIEEILIHSAKYVGLFDDTMKKTFDTRRTLTVDIPELTQALTHLINKARIDELKDMLEADNDPTQCVHCEILSRIKELEK